MRPYAAGYAESENREGPRCRGPEPGGWAAAGPAFRWCRQLLIKNKLSPTQYYLMLMSRLFQIEKYDILFIEFVTYVHAYLHKRVNAKIGKSFSSL